MVAQRKAIPTTRATTPRRRKAATAQPQQTASDDGDDPSRELLALQQLQQLQTMRADALAWLAEIERRIGMLECLVQKPVEGKE